MIVEFIYTSTRRQKKTAVRHVLVLDPRFRRSDGKGGLYLWGIDLAELTPAQFQMAINRFSILAAGPKSVDKKHKMEIPIVDIPGGTGLQRYNLIRTVPILLKNYRSFDIMKIPSYRVVQYNFVDINLYDPSKYENALLKKGLIEVKEGEYTDIESSIDSKKQFGKKKPTTQEDAKERKQQSKVNIDAAKESAPESPQS